MNIGKLPHWVQDYITKLQRERDTAVKALNNYCDSQTPSPIYFDNLECTGEEQGPSVKRQYIQSHGRITVEYEGVLLNVYTIYGPYIDLQWSSLRYSGTDVAFIPESFCKARLVAKQNMRD